MRFLVTGGTGFIGSHTCLLLLEKGHEVVVIDSLVNSHKKSLERVIDILKPNNKNEKLDFICADIRDEQVLDKIFSEYQRLDKPIQAVIHFAGLKSAKDSVLRPLLYWDVNVNGSLKLLRIMDKYKCRTIVFSSSATIYGLSSDKPLTESSEIKPINPYGETKASIENLLSDIYFSCPRKWRIASLRYFNPIGAHSSGLIGEFPKGVPDNIFPYITQVAAGIRKKLIVFGNDWPTIDGTGVRDYIHVVDLAEGHILALEYLLGSDSQIINLNLGTGIGTSVFELVHTFEQVNNIKIPFEISCRREGDSPIVIADNSLAVSSLGWLPKRSIKEMCIDGWKWQSLNLNGFS